MDDRNVGSVKNQMPISQSAVIIWSVYSLTKASLGVGVDILVLAPLHHALKDGHKTL